MYSLVVYISQADEPDSHYRLYSDGSKTEHGVGAAAVTETGLHRVHRLGDPGRHTVFEAELIGIYLALALVNDHLPPSATHCTIFVDNQAAITAVGSRPQPQSGQYIILRIHDRLRDLRRTRPRLCFRLAWLPGHEGIPFNELVDRHAKQATQPPGSPEDAPLPQHHTPLPFPLRASLSATREAIKRHFAAPPQDLSNGQAHRLVRGGRTPKQTFDMLASLPRGACSILVQLRTAHIALHSYLHRFKISDSPNCRSCLEPETVDHFLLRCRSFLPARRRLLDSVARLGLEERTGLPTLLSHPKVVPLTVAFVKATGRFPLHTPSPAVAPSRGRTIRSRQ